MGSTLINQLLGEEIAKTGKTSKGVTKELTSYNARLGSRPYRLWDMPGAGDMDVPTFRTLEMLGAAFQNEPIHGLFLLSAKPDRMSLGAQLVATLMDLSFSNPDKWSSVVLVGTKSDKYDPGDEQNFKTDVLCTFNELVKGSITKVCTCNHKDISAVQDMIELLSGEAGVGDYTTHKQLTSLRCSATSTAFLKEPLG